MQKSRAPVAGCAVMLQIRSFPKLLWVHVPSFRLRSHTWGAPLLVEIQAMVSSSKKTALLADWTFRKSARLDMKLCLLKGSF